MLIMLAPGRRDRGQYSSIPAAVKDKDSKMLFVVALIRACLVINRKRGHLISNNIN